METQWISIEDATKYLSVSEDTIRRMIARGDIKARRFGPRLIRIDLNELANSGRPVA